MRKPFLVAAFAGVVISAALDANAQDRSWRRTEDPLTRKNSITILGSVQGWGKYHSLGFWHVGFEYDRMLHQGLSFSATGLYAPMNIISITDVYGQEEIFTFAGAKINYNLPVLRGLLYFRFGVGGGVGWHQITGYQRGELATKPTPAFFTYVKPHLIIDAYWVFRAARWLDLRFSPLIISPSQFIVGGKFNEAYKNSTFRYFNIGTLGATVRF